MSVVIELAQTADAKRMLAQKALEQELFRHGWMLEPELRHLATGVADSYLDICVAWVEKKTVGVAIYFTEGSREGHPTPFKKRVVICYVKPEHRLKGIGRKLVNGFDIPAEQMISYYGEPMTANFWQKVGTNYQGMFVYD